MPIALDRVGLRFDDGEFLFRGITFTVEDGTVVSLTGPSGSGKSSLLRLIAGWSEPTEGRIDRSANAVVSWIFQTPEGMPHRSALDHVSLPLIGRGLRRKEAEIAARVLLERVELPELADRPFEHLSGGEAQRLMLARTLAYDPDILLVDEPTAQLDAATSRKIIDALRSLSGQGLTVIIATHDHLVTSATDTEISLINLCDSAQ